MNDVETKIDKDLMAMKLHVDDEGNVWYSYSDEPPKNTNKSVIEFIQTKQSQFPLVRMVGMKQNVDLMLALYGRRLKKDSGCIELCTPAICKTNVDRGDPEKILTKMRKVDRASSVGGWHVMDRTDYPTYAIASYLNKTGLVDDNVRRLLKEHPIWPIISFIPHLDIDMSARLVAEIVDPRWYVDIKHASRGSKLRSYLGLDIPYMKNVLNGRMDSVYEKRCSIVLNTWNNDDDNSMLENPYYFLYRVMKGYREKGKEVIAYLRASQKFIEFVRLVWLAYLGINTKQLESLFVPEYFFKQEAETIAFKEHFKRIMR